MIPSAGAKKYEVSQYFGRNGSRKKWSWDNHLTGLERIGRTSVSIQSARVLATRATPFLSWNNSGIHGIMDVSGAGSRRACVAFPPGNRPVRWFRSLRPSLLGVVHQRSQRWDRLIGTAPPPREAPAPRREYSLPVRSLMH